MAGREMKMLSRLEKEVVACEGCPRLREWCKVVAQRRRRAYADWEYWGRPVPGFGDPNASLLVLGLAPAAHGANRTGRVFTGDRSGDWLFRAMFETGFASQAESSSVGDGLTLTEAWVTASVKCAPPENKPLPGEILQCRSFLEREIEALPLKAVVVLGRLAFDNYLTIARASGAMGPKPSFTHDGEHALGPGLPVLISSYHPSQQNTQTGRLTREMLRTVFQRARRIVDST